MSSSDLTLRLGVVPIKLHGGGELRIRAKDIAACRVHLNVWTEDHQREAILRQMQGQVQYYRAMHRVYERDREDWEEQLRRQLEALPPPVRHEEQQVFIRVCGVDTEYRVAETLERIEEIMRDS